MVQGDPILLLELSHLARGGVLNGIERLTTLLY